MRDYVADGHASHSNTTILYIRFGRATAGLYIGDIYYEQVRFVVQLLIF
jgi:hypothetical protein